MAITDAKVSLGLPVGASAVKKLADNTAPTVRYVPVGATIATVSGTAATAYPGVYYVAGVRLTGASSAVIDWLDSGAATISSVSLGSVAAGGYVQGGGVAPPTTATARVVVTGTSSSISLQPCVPLVESPYTEPSTTGTFASGGVSYGVSGDSAFLGDVFVYDMGAQTDGTLAGSSYTRVYDRRHVFVGDTLIDNGIVRLWLQRGYAGSAAVRLSVYAEGSWRSFIAASIDTAGGTTATLRSIGVKALSRNSVVVDVVDTDGNKATLTMRRGWHAVKVETLRVADAGSSYQEFELDDDSRFVAYNASTLIKDHSLSAGSANVAGSGLTEPYALGLAVTKPYMVAVGMASKPTTLYHESSGQIVWRLTSAGTSALEKTFWLTALPWPWLTNGAYLKEAESATMAGGAASAVDATASGGNVAALDANGETVDYTFVAGTDVPLGHYTAIIRAKDTAAVASDCTMSINNNTDASSIASSAKTLTGSYAFYTLDFELVASASGDTIRFRAAKSTATANTISVDYFLLVPRKRNSATPSHVFFPYDVSRNALMDTAQRESVRRA